MKYLLYFGIILITALSSCKENVSHTSTEFQDNEISTTKTKENKNGSKEISETKQSACTCFNGIGSSKGDKPILESKFTNGTKLITCGYFDQEIQQAHLMMSEFNIFDCDTGKSLVEYGAVQTCRIKESPDKILVEELKFLPAGIDWKWELIKIGEQEILLKNQKIDVSDPIPSIDKLQFPKALQIEFLNSIKKEEGNGDHWEDELGKLEVLALIGNKEAWKILKNYEVYKGIEADGALAEQLKDALANVEWHKKY